jgi:hypothetical protein
LFATPSEKKHSLKELVQNEEKQLLKEASAAAWESKESSIWESDPIEIDSVKVQILDKISGKVYKKDVKVNSVIEFGSIKLKLKRCFKNGPEDNEEVYALIEITENERVIFSNWLFASSPQVNLFSHPVYDIRIEF